METIHNIIEWLKANYDSVIACWTCIIGAAEIIVKWCDSARGIVIVDKIRSLAVLIISWLTKFGFESKKEEKK